jgi:5-methylcytosine-specific restriction protein B
MPNAHVVRKVRSLDADELGVGYTARAVESPGSSAPDAPVLQPDDPRLLEAERLLRQFGGLILSGPPGTGKSLLAAQIADHLSEGDTARRQFVQFHASYQFEDFMEGFRPKKNGNGFEPREGVFLSIVRAADLDPGHTYVLVIDELSRADVGRVFGEALTYIERSKRGLKFTLPSGDPCSIPMNLYVIATMNPLDRGVDEVDAAFERRFAKWDMPPSADALEVLLAGNGLDEDIRRRLVGWFRRINSWAPNIPAAAVGHAYFSDVVDAQSLQDVWDYQLKYLVDRAFQYDPDSRTEVIRGWETIFAAIPPESAADARDADEGALTAER